jgi:hypothetical protein
MTPLRADHAARGVLKLTAAPEPGGQPLTVLLEFPEEKLTPTVETVSVEQDERLSKSWVKPLYRIVLILKTASLKDQCRLSVRME